MLHIGRIIFFSLFAWLITDAVSDKQSQFKTNSFSIYQIRSFGCLFFPGFGPVFFAFFFFRLNDIDLKLLIFMDFFILLLLRTSDCAYLFSTACPEMLIKMARSTILQS